MDKSKHKLTPQQKLDLAQSLYLSAKELKKQSLKQLYPELSDDEINKIIKKNFLYAAG